MTPIFKKQLGFDLGTDTTQIYLKESGIVLNEPSIVAFNNRTNRIVAIGHEGKKMLSRTPAHITALRPIVHGVIADFDMAKEMIQRFLKQKEVPWSLLTRVVVSTPTNLTEVERKSVEDLLKEVGASEVYLVEQPLAAAIGSRLEINQPVAYLIIDIGSGTTDIAVVAMIGIVISKRLKVAGDYFNDEIIRFTRDEFKLDIGQLTAEEIKLAVGSTIPQSDRLEVVVRGRDAITGLPKEVIIKDTQVRFWLQRPLKIIIEAVKDLIESTPPELVGDIYRNGIYVCGGSSLLRGIAQTLQKEIGVEVKIVEDALTCVARGTGLITEELNTYRHLLNNFSN